MVALTVARESWPIEGGFTISRGTKTHAEVLVVTLLDDTWRDGGVFGRGECVPYARYGESLESVEAEIEALRGDLESGLDRAALQGRLKPGAARNAVDCALADLEAKRTRVPVWQILGLEAAPGPVTTAYTLSLDTPENMAAKARANANRPLFKLKLTGEGDLDRVAAVREAAPRTRLIVDANEGWAPEMVEPYSRELAALGVEMIEQPLPAGADAMLADIDHPVTLCADESAHARDGLDALVGRYDMINIKLDKTGGVTEALALKHAAEAAGLEIMVGCMLATSLAMAPAVLVGQGARVVDLDGPLLLSKDRDPALRFEGSTIHPPEPALWG
ncbi:dipeptide epimerase [Marivibrio halodurans]|uniref:Dipeptide epimerase n=1 Tax=Marivibrio halodurans TaxID=2039722 RepID=A0A8J7RY09_9PROT|nr:N-acetyl-D-Glu racemase DgcA [Marivibrio halodurans]MBP5856832.1 dipeptide epimerase [Marivibrio halodurans]